MVDLYCCVDWFCVSSYFDTNLNEMNDFVRQVL